jgi:hypothetical protein
LDYLFAELDRQLNQTQQHANTQAQRCGLAITASALAAALFVVNFDSIKGGEIASLCLFGVATLIGLGALVPALVVGPSPAKLAAWATMQPSRDATTALYDGKVTALEANLRRLAFMSSAFYLQVVSVVAAVIAGIASTIGR